MKSILAVFIIAVMVLSVTIPLNTVHAQVVIEDISDPLNDDIIMTKITFVMVLCIFGLLIVIVIVVITMYRRFGRGPPNIFNKDK